MILFGLYILLIDGYPFFVKQRRVGLHGEPFNMFKFRTMKKNSHELRATMEELNKSDGPLFKIEQDPRILKGLSFARKFSIDELLQFINVFKGDMSIVGPRPERRFFFDQIIAAAPQYRYLLKVKPGITSWGMVKYGYAENVEEMIERARYDLIYTENITLVNDIKILFYTLVTVLQGRGK